MGQDEIKIRSLPRGSEKPPKEQPKEHDDETKTTRWIVYVGTICLMVLATLISIPKRPAVHSDVVRSRPAFASRIQQTDMASVQRGRPPRDLSTVDRYAQEALMKQQILMHQRELENMQFAGRADKPSDEQYLALPEDQRNLGVQLDGDKSAERVFEDLNDSAVADEKTPVDLINSRLANLKWVSELERRERITFIKGVIQSAHDRGYELEINQDLVVVGMKRVPQDKLLNINQVVDRLAKGI